MLRGKWMLENLLGTPPPPPPPDVPALEDRDANGRPGAVDARSDGSSIAPIRPAPAATRVMDPIGFALENFDAIGRWRAKDNGRPLDVSSPLPGRDDG